MKQGIKKILLNYFNNKHVTLFLIGSDASVASGFIRDIEVDSDFNSSFIRFTFDQGNGNTKVFECGLNDFKLEIC